MPRDEEDRYGIPTERVAACDDNNGRLDFPDVVWLFNDLSALATPSFLRLSAAGYTSPLDAIQVGPGVRDQHTRILLIAEAGEDTSSIRRDLLSPAVSVCPIAAIGII